MTNEWFALGSEILILLSCALLFVGSVSTFLLMAEALHVKNPGKVAPQFKSTAKWAFVLWALNTIATGIFGLFANWFSAGKWEIWASYGASLVLSVALILLSHKLKKSASNAVVILFFFAMMLIASVLLIAAVISQYPIPISPEQNVPFFP